MARWANGEKVEVGLLFRGGVYDAEDAPPLPLPPVGRSLAWRGRGRRRGRGRLAGTTPFRPPADGAVGGDHPVPPPGRRDACGDLKRGLRAVTVDEWAARTALPDAWDSKTKRARLPDGLTAMADATGLAAAKRYAVPSGGVVGGVRGGGLGGARAAGRGGTTTDLAAFGAGRSSMFSARLDGAGTAAAVTASAATPTAGAGWGGGDAVGGPRRVPDGPGGRCGRRRGGGGGGCGVGQPLGGGGAAGTSSTVPGSASSAGGSSSAVPGESSTVAGGASTVAGAPRPAAGSGGGGASSRPVFSRSGDDATKRVLASALPRPLRPHLAGRRGP